MVGSPSLILQMVLRTLTFSILYVASNDLSYSDGTMTKTVATMSFWSRETLVPVAFFVFQWRDCLFQLAQEVFLSVYFD